MSEYLVLGAYPFLYVGTSVSGHNCDFEYKKEIREGYKLCVTKDNEDYTLSLTVEEGECGSGWCTASWGHCNLVKSNTKEKITLVPKSGFELIEFEDGYDDVDNELFSVSYDGGDSYYPVGHAYLHMDNWEVKGRG